MRLDHKRSIKDVAEAARTAAAAAVRADLLERAKVVPVIDVAIVVGGGPLFRTTARYGIIIPGVGETKGDDMLDTCLVTPDYFRVMDMPLIRGRLFQPSDRADPPLIMLINDVAARRLFPDRDPVGQVVTFHGATMSIGVLHNVPTDGPEEEVRPQMYLPVDQDDQNPSYTLGRFAAIGIIAAMRATGATYDAVVSRGLYDGLPGQPETALTPGTALTPDP